MLKGLKWKKLGIKKDEPCQKDIIAMNAAALVERHITLKETNINEFKLLKMVKVWGRILFC